MAGLMKVSGLPIRVGKTRMNPEGRKCLKRWLPIRLSGISGFLHAVALIKPKRVFEGVISGSLFLSFNPDKSDTRIESNNNRGLRASGFSPGSRVAEPGAFWASIAPFRNARALISATDKKATTRPGWIAPTPRQITTDYLADTLNRQARLSFFHPKHSPRKGKVRNDADMTTRRTRSHREATSPETARNARGTQAIRLPARRLSETRTAARASRREERATIARAATILTTQKEPTYD